MIATDEPFSTFVWGKKKKKYELYDYKIYIYITKIYFTDSVPWTSLVPGLLLIQKEIERESMYDIYIYSGESLRLLNR